MPRAALRGRYAVAIPAQERARAQDAAQVFFVSGAAACVPVEIAAQGPSVPAPEGDEGGFDAQVEKMNCGFEHTMCPTFRCVRPAFGDAERHLTLSIAL